MIYDKHDLDMQYYYNLEQQLKKTRTTIIDPDEELLNKEVPIRVLKLFSSNFRKSNLLFLMFETNIYIADKLYLDKHYESAASWYMKVLKEVECLKFYNKTPHIYYRLGVCELKMCFYTDALVYLKKAKIVSSEQNDNSTYSKTLYHLADSYLYLKDYDNSDKYTEELMNLYQDDKVSYDYIAGSILKAKILYYTGSISKAASIFTNTMLHINDYELYTQEHAYIEAAEFFYNIHNKKSVYYSEIALRLCMKTKDYDFILHLSSMLDTMYQYYHIYSSCYENMDSLIKFMSDKQNRKYCYISLTDILIMKIRRLHYKCRSLSQSDENI